MLALFLMTAIASADEPKCKGNTKVVAACYAVHGRAKFGADTIRIWIWPVGTKRMLGVTGGPVPDDVVDPICPRQLKFVSADDTIYGDFEVCPFTPRRKGSIQMVCVESVSNVVVKHATPSQNVK